MNAEKTGALIRDARISRKLTQKQLAELVGVTDKAISKWEKGRGCPDITLLRNLSLALELDIQSILRGEQSPAKSHGGNMNRIKFYRCPDCGNLISSLNQIELSCCGKRLSCLKPQTDSRLPELIPEVSEFDGQYNLKFNHPMTKENHIAHIITVQYDRTTVINLFAEQEALVTIPQISGIRLYAVTNRNQLYEIKA